MTQSTNPPKGLDALPLLTPRYWLAVLPMLAAFFHLMQRGNPAPEIVAGLLAGPVLVALPFHLSGVLGRGALWFCFMGLASLGLFMRPMDEGFEEFLALVWALGWCVALLGRPPSSSNSAFAPSAFGATLTAGLILGAADAFWMVLGGTAALREQGSMSQAWTPVLWGLATLVLVALWGTARLRAWGVLLGVACNVAVVAIMGHQAAGESGDDRVALLVLTAGAGIHLLLQAPLLWAMVVGRPPAWATRPMHHAGRVVVALLVVAVTARLGLLACAG